MFPEKSISSLFMSSSYHEKLELQKALCSLLKQIFENPEESPVRQKSIETLLLMLDHLPLKSRLSGLQKYYDKAIEVTKRDVSKNIANFPVKYNLDITEISDRDLEGLAKLEKCFVSWVLMILRPDCIDEHRKTKRKFNRINEDGDVYDVNRRKGLGDYIKDKQGKITGRIDQKLSADIEGNFIGDNFLDGIDSMLEKEKLSLKQIGKQLKEYIEQDPDNKLKELHPRNQEDCNCQVLLQLFLLENLSMDEVYEQLKCKGYKKGTIRNYLTEYKEEGSRKERSCLNLIQAIANNKFNL